MLLEVIDWLSAGSQLGGKAVAIALTLVKKAKLNDVDRQAWLIHVFDRIAGHEIVCLDEFNLWRYAAVSA